MAIICPTITAYSQEDYKKQMDKILHLGHRIQIDLTDGIFTKEKTVLPGDAWWPVGFKADFHLMYETPLEAVQIILQHKPNLVIVHAEAKGGFNDVASFCRQHSVPVGVALLQQTNPDTIIPALEGIDHVLIFSGNLGYQGGSHADFGLLDKARVLKQHKPELEIGWDGGVNDQNISQLISGGVDVLNVGGYLQNAEDPAKAFATLQRIADETGTT